MSLKILLVITLAAIIVAAASCNIYFVRNDSGGTLLWNDHEAYLFLGAGSVGYKVSYLEYPVVRLKEYFLAPPFPSHKTLRMTVIHVTPSHVENHIVTLPEPAGPAFLTPFEETFYAMCPGAVLCKWDGANFVAASKEEERRFGGLDHLVRPGIDGKTINGWSARDT